jgi:hypothetical protein
MTPIYFSDVESKSNGGKMRDGNYIGLLIFGCAYTYAFLSSKARVTKRLRLTTEIGGGGEHALRNRSAIDVFWLILSSLAVEMVFIAVIAVLALYLWNFVIEGSVRMQISALVMTGKSSSESDKVGSVQKSLGVAFGNLFDADVISFLVYAMTATMIYTYYSLMFLRTRRRPLASHAEYDRVISDVYRLNFVLTLGLIALRMM